jgi:hypothetical protein
MGDADFTLSIRIEGSELVDDPTSRAQGIARMLREVAAKVEADQESGIIKDINGNTVGSWEFD